MIAPGPRADRCQCTAGPRAWRRWTVSSAISHLLSLSFPALLLEHGAYINARDIDHESTAVQYMVSIRPYRHDVAGYLIIRGAEADILSAPPSVIWQRSARFSHTTPTWCAPEFGEKYFPKVDPRSGGSIYIFGFGWGKTPHMVAHQFGHGEIFELLMQRSSPWIRLAQACEIHDEALARQIVAEHPRLIENLSPAAARRIIGATLRNNTKAVELLLEAKLAQRGVQRPESNAAALRRMARQPRSGQGSPRPEGAGQHL